MQTPALNPDIGMYLIERYPGMNRTGLQGLWLTAWCWIEENVSPQYLLLGKVPATFEAAALFRVQSLCTQDATKQQALMFAAYEALMPYSR